MTHMSLTHILIRLSPKLPMTRMGMVRCELKNSNGISILDLGCGDGQSMRLILNGLKKGFLIAGIDAYPKHLVKAQKTGLYSKVWHGDIRNWNYEPKSYDIILFCEVLEHLPKKDGHQLLNRLDKVAKDMIIITTPAYSDIDPHVKRDEPIEARIERGEFWRIPHISVWTKKEFEEHGYTVRGANGLYIPHLPYMPRMMLGMLLTPLIWLSPNRANTLVAVKSFK